MKDKKMKIALYKNAGSGFETVSDDSYDDLADYVRVTEYVEVEFISLDHNDVAAKEVAILEEVKKTLMAETEVKLGVIDRRIGDLLALPELKETP